VASLMHGARPTSVCDGHLGTNVLLGAVVDTRTSASDARGDACHHVTVACGDEDERCVLKKVVPFDIAHAHSPLAHAQLEDGGGAPILAGEIVCKPIRTNDNHAHADQHHLLNETHVKAIFHANGFGRQTCTI